MQRRDFIKTAGAIALSAVAANAAASEAKGASMAKTEKIGGLNLTTEWDKVFPKSDKVNHRKVTFKNRYGITLAADLYEPKNAKAGAKLAAIAVSGPYGAVKEQSSGLYAQTLAERGFVTLAFDPSYTGESGGEPRDISSPDINTEDFSAAVDFLGLLPEVDREKIGILGICGFGGFALNAAIADPRIKAVVASTMYDMTRVSARGYNDAMSADERYAARKKVAMQRWADAKNGEQAYLPAGNIDPATIDANTPKFVADYALYYRTPRGYHPRSINSSATHFWRATNTMPLMGDKILAYADELRAPALLVHGEKAHSRYFSEGAFKALKGNNKRLLIVPGAYHTDLYDNLEKIPFGEIEKFFKSNLK